MLYSFLQLLNILSLNLGEVLQDHTRQISHDSVKVGVLYQLVHAYSSLWVHHQHPLHQVDSFRTHVCYVVPQVDRFILRKQHSLLVDGLNSLWPRVVVGRSQYGENLVQLVYRIAARKGLEAEV